MQRKNKEYSIIENILVEDYASEGKSIARVNDFVVFIDNAVPGDIIDLKIRRKKKNFAEGTAIRFISYSKFRTNAFCEHFGLCGGCKWQNLDYDKQLEYKQTQIVDNIKRIGKVFDFTIKNIKASPFIKFYRNKLEFSFSNKRWFTNEEMHDENKINEGLGFHIPKMFDRILNINNCYLQEEPSNSIRIAVRDFTIENNFSYYDYRKSDGLMRNLIIRTSTTKEIMVLFSFRENDVDKITNLLNFIKNKFPEITSLLYSINPQLNDSLYNYNQIITFYGRGYIYEKLGNLKFKIGPKSFFQTNTFQAEKMYEYIKDNACLEGNETVYDLYTGTGTIANFIADKCSKVIGVDYVDDAIIDAIENSKINNLNNTVFYAGDMKDIFNDDFLSKNPKADIIITDPPRAGMHLDVIKTIIKANPRKLIYVSCNPSTQARDIELLKSEFKLISIQPFDMFPHTQHVENIAIFENIN